MKKKKTKPTLDKVEESIQTLKLSGSRNLKSIFRDLSALKENLLSLGSIGPSDKSGEVVERSTSSLDNIERRATTLENSLGDNISKLVQEYQRSKVESKDLEDERRTFRTLYELSDIIYSERDVNALLEEVVDSVIEITSCERCFLRIYEDGNNIKISVAKNSEKKEIGEETNSINEKVIDAAAESGNAICITQLLVSDPEEEKESGSFETASILCVPLKSRDKVLGVMYLDDTKKDSYFTPDDASLLTSLGERVGVALENNLLFTELKESQEKLLQDLRGRFNFDEILGNSPQMVEVLKTVADVADTDATVLIEGESGTGKELLARALHFNSNRSKKPFVPINCAAIPETLLESELFGYEKGAFTGAEQRKPGKFERANGGTIFLDEIGEMSPMLQVKILRFLQSRQFEPLGSNRVKKSDVRIIAATNKDLLSLVKENGFREDLFYRINVINIKLPPLRERKLDIEPLAESFALKFGKKNGKKIKGLDPEALNVLTRYGFPGNIRELENIIERAAILAQGEWITKEELPKTLFEGNDFDYKIKIPQNYGELKALKKKAVEEIEKSFLSHILTKNNDVVSKAAEEARMHRVELHRLINKYKEDFKESRKSRTEVSHQ
ncbi:MAG: sigma 54-interacting transcriptional regulator [Candidatus Zixiibacteriota bacterium]